MIRVIITDDHEVVRIGIKGILEKDPDIKVTGEAGSGEDLLSKIEHEDYDVVLLDITMSGRDGLYILEQLKEVRPHLPVLIFSIHMAENYAIRALKSGASGYMNKKAPAEEIIKAVKLVYSGEKYISQSLAGKIAEEFIIGKNKTPHEKLSNREFEVLLHLANGISIKDIGNKLSLSPKTITTYRARILEKMGFSNNADLTKYVLAHNLLEEFK